MDALTRDETKNLTRCEKTIATGLTTFFSVGQALWDIRDAKLYRGSHDTFDVYCEERWDFSRQRAHQLIAAAEVSADLSTIVDICPERESHVRPLLAVPAEHRAEVWQRAVDTAPKDDAGRPKITARHVSETVADWQDEQQKAEQQTVKPVEESPVIDVESRPVEVKPDPPVTAPECPNCGCSEWAEDEQGYYCKQCKEPLGGQVEEAPEPEESPDDLVLDSIEDLIRDQFDGRLAVAAARLETLAEKLRRDI